MLPHLHIETAFLEEMQGFVYAGRTLNNLELDDSPKKVWHKGKEFG